MKKLILEVNSKRLVAKDVKKLPNGNTVLVTPPLNEDFWLWRVKVGKRQAIVAFPKFMQIGCGFQIEKDWNTNLPLACDSETIFDHIKHNAGEPGIRKEDCVRAIDMIREAAVAAGAVKLSECDRMNHLPEHIRDNLKKASESRERPR